MINRERAQKFQQEINALLQTLSFDSQYAIFKSQLLDYLSGLIGKETPDQRELQNALGRMFNPQLGQFTRDVLKEFNTVIDLVNTDYKDMGVDVARDFPKLRAIEQTLKTNLGNYKDSTIRDINKKLRKGLIAGDNYRKIARELAKADDKSRFFAETIARTQVKAYGRVSKNTKSEIAAIVYFEYIGILRPTSREFCKLLVDTTHHIDDIRKMRNGNREPVLEFCGGWNCHHDWEPDPFATSATPGKKIEKQVGRKKLKVITPKDPATEQEFTPAKNIKEAQQFARDNGLAESIDYRGLKMPIVNQVNKTLLQLKKETGQTFTRIFTESSSQDFVMSFSPFVFGDITNTSLTINTRYFKKFSNITEADNHFKSLSDRGWFQPQNTQEVIWHEFGHLLTRSWNISKLQKFDAENKPFNGLGDYAKSSVAESLAELYVKVRRDGVKGIKKSYIKTFNSISKVKL
jgi:hypothetical protein